MIQTRNITKEYVIGSQTVRALDGVSLNVAENEYLSLVGPSGSGKSTLMNILGALDRPSSGDYLLREREVGRLEDEALADVRNSEIGFVFQTFNLIPRMTAVENVALPLVYAGISKTERIERSREMLIQVGLKDRMDHKPNELSGGQRQRVAVARALINHPSILLADEPTGNLDSKTTNEIMNLFDGLHERGHTIIIVTHEAEIAARTRRVLHMRDGKIEKDEPLS